MKHSLVILACAGFLLATFVNNSQAQFTIPTNPGDPETPGTSGPSRPVLSYPTGREPRTGGAILFTTPTISRVGIVNGRVRFTFDASGSDTLMYKIGWSRGKSGGGLFDRPSKAEVDIRWTGAHDANGTRLEDYTINEMALPDTIYTFKVQAIRKPYTEITRVDDRVNGTTYDRKRDVPREETAFVSKSFLTPPLPSIADILHLPLHSVAQELQNSALPVGQVMAHAQRRRVFADAEPDHYVA